MIRALTHAILLLIAILSATCYATDSTESVITLNKAQFIASDNPSPGAAGWQTVVLPDNWRIRRPELSGYAWYRIRFTLRAPPSQPLALYVPHVALVATFWLNGSLLNPGVVFDRPGRMGTSMSESPIYIVLPSGLFHSGENFLDVRLQGDTAIRSGLSAPMLGPPSMLQRCRHIRRALQMKLPNILLVTAVAALAFLLAHMWHQRKTHLIQVAAIAAMLALASYSAFTIPISRDTQQVLRVLATIAEHWPLIIIGYRMAGGGLRWFLPTWNAVTVLTLAAVGVCVAAGDVSDRIWMLTWPHLLLRFAVIYLLIRKACEERSIKLAALAITGAIWLATIVQSLMILMDWLPWDSFRWSSSGAAPLVIVLLFVFAEQFILDRAEAAVAHRSAIASERSRILQEMHDGMGAHLVAALHLARREDVPRPMLVQSIEESLQDLRSIIDSLDLHGQDLLPMLANLRFRLEPRLQALGLTLIWDVDAPLPELTDLTPESALAVLRIVQESVNNAIQHANAHTLRIRARAEGGAVCIEITDDGQGFDPASVRTGGRGLASMRLRAEKLSASLRLDTGCAGTTVRLRIPLNPVTRQKENVPRDLLDPRKYLKRGIHSPTDKSGNFD